MGHPLRNELEWIGSDAEKGYDARVFQVFPHDGLPAEDLRVILVVVEREGDCFR